MFSCLEAGTMYSRSSNAFNQAPCFFLASRFWRRQYSRIAGSDFPQSLAISPPDCQFTLNVEGTLDVHLKLSENLGNTEKRGVLFANASKLSRLKTWLNVNIAI